MTSGRTFPASWRLDNGIWTTASEQQGQAVPVPFALSEQAPGAVRHAEFRAYPAHVIASRAKQSQPLFNGRILPCGATVKYRSGSAIAPLCSSPCLPRPNRRPRQLSAPNFELAARMSLRAERSNLNRHSADKSFHAGFRLSMSRILFARDPALILFSAAMASVIRPNSS
jgi:hypothetical protein